MHRALAVSLLTASIISAASQAQPVILSLGPTGPYVGSGARAVSADGLTIGGDYLTDTSLSPYIWTPAAGITLLNDDWLGRVTAISADGAAAAGSHSNGGTEFRWTRSQGVSQ